MEANELEHKILVVDDEVNIADIIKFNLEKDGYRVLTANDGEAGMKLYTKEKPDLVVLDIMMPKKDGLQVLKEIRATSTVPVIMLTAKEDELDKVLGLELGADDYMTKPFSVRELAARVKANLRRVEFVDVEHKSDNVIRTGDLEIDLDKYEVRKFGEVVEITIREFELLKFLAQSANRVFSREQLLTDVWGYEYYGDIRTVDVTIRRLRSKIEDGEEEKEKYIVTKRGVGYYFKSE